MSNVHTRARRMMVGALAITLMCCAANVRGHVHWTRVNSVDANTIALYHFTNTAPYLAPAEPPLAAGLGLVPQAGTLAPTPDTADAIFGPAALQLPAAQTLRSTDAAQNLDGDLTIECWFKWSSTMTQSTLEFGLQSGARVHLRRDVAEPGNDRFGIAATHGSFIDAPDFTNWIDVGEHEASLNEWRHLGLTIHSTGIIHDPEKAHDVYAPGSIGRLYLNGHLVGFAPANAIDLAGLQVHDASRLTIIMQGGGMFIDEFTVWRKDFSENGTVANPFSNGRGDQSSVADWTLYSD